MSGFSSQKLFTLLPQSSLVRRYWIAYSGGLDSHVLLHAMAGLENALPGIELCAVHVNHNLSSQAKEWALHCLRVCEALQISCQQLVVDAHPKKGESPEAAARDVRYQAIARCIEANDCLLTAHHQDDQAETLLLQLLRGAGTQGLAAMPAQTNFSQGLLARPLLSFSRQQLREYAELHQLHWIDDPSNAKTDFDRNYLRHEVMPLLQSRWPSASKVISRSARHQAESSRLLNILAEQDYCAARGRQPNTLSVNFIKQLDIARQHLLLRYWIKQLKLPIPASIHIEHILHDAVNAAPDAMPCICWPGGEVRRYQDDLYAMLPLSRFDASLEIPWHLDAPLNFPQNNGFLVAKKTEGQGLDCDFKEVVIRFRQGGESCRPIGSNCSKSLKKLFQEKNISPWLRDRTPLLYVGEQLAVVVGVCFCEPFGVDDNVSGWRFEWSLSLF